MNDDTHGARTRIRLRFLAEAAIELLSGATGESYASQASIPPDASEDMLRALLGHAVPVLRATIHQQLADQIEAVLAEPQRDERPIPVVRSDVLLISLAVAVLSAVCGVLHGSPGTD